MQKLKFKKFTDQTIAATETSWLQDKGSHAFPSDIDTVIAAIKKQSDYADKTLEWYTYGIFDDKKPQAIAVIKVIVSKTGRRLIKMIDCILKPSIEDSAIQSSPDALQLVPRIYAEAINGTIALTQDHKADVVKVYGRSNELLRALATTALILDSHLPASVTIEGRWLVFSNKKK
jgi:hypothetical protein